MKNTMKTNQNFNLIIMMILRRTNKITFDRNELYNTCYRNYPCYNILCFLMYFVPDVFVYNSSTIDTIHCMAKISGKWVFKVTHTQIGQIGGWTCNSIVGLKDISPCYDEQYYYRIPRSIENTTSVAS